MDHRPALRGPSRPGEILEGGTVHRAPFEATLTDFVVRHATLAGQWIRGWIRELAANVLLDCALGVTPADVAGDSRVLLDECQVSGASGDPETSCDQKVRTGKRTYGRWNAALVATVTSHRAALVAGQGVGLSVRIDNAIGNITARLPHVPDTPPGHRNSSSALPPSRQQVTPAMGLVCPRRARSRRRGHRGCAGEDSHPPRPPLMPALCHGGQLSHVRKEQRGVHCQRSTAFSRRTRRVAHPNGRVPIPARARRIVGAFCGVTIDSHVELGATTWSSLDEA